MKSTHFPRCSLRLRFTLGLAAMLLPFLGAAAIGQFYLLPRLTGPYEFIAEEIVVSLEHVRRLQIMLPRPGMPANDYLITGDPLEREQYHQLSRQVDGIFESALASHLTLASEQGLVKAAHEEWRQAQASAEVILRLDKPIGNIVGRREMQVLDAHLDRAVALLDRVYEISNREVMEGLAMTVAAKQRALFVTMVAFTAAFGISLFAGFLLVRPALAAIGALGSAASRLSAGDLSARVVMEREDELGQLALAFNAMAEKIEQHQRALEDLAVHDGLTDLFNHREFERRLAEEMARARRYRRPFALLMLDIDRFKAVNDTYGHQVGDEVLRVVAARVQRRVRPVDRIARYGGEEFVVILPETAADGAFNMAERIREGVTDTPIPVEPGRSLDVTISIGVAAFPADADNEEGLVAAADQAMYAAKQAGRNCARLFSGGAASA